MTILTFLSIYNISLRYPKDTFILGTHVYNIGDKKMAQIIRTVAHTIKLCSCERCMAELRHAVKMHKLEVETA